MIKVCTHILQCQLRGRVVLRLSCCQVSIKSKFDAGRSISIGLGKRGAINASDSWDEPERATDVVTNAPLYYCNAVSPPARSRYAKVRLASKGFLALILWHACYKPLINWVGPRGSNGTKILPPKLHTDPTRSFGFKKPTCQTDLHA